MGTRWWIFALLIALALGLVWWLLPGVDDGGLSTEALVRGGDERPEVAQSGEAGARLTGAPRSDETSPAEIPDEEADLKTLLARIEVWPRPGTPEVPEVTAAQRARLLELLRADPDMLRHVVRVALGLDVPDPELWPPQFMGRANTWHLRAMPILGGLCVPLLLEVWRDPPDAHRRDAVLGVVQRLGPAVAGMVPDLAAVLRDAREPERFRSRTLLALRHVGRAAGEVGPDLLAWARNADAAFHYEGLYALADVVGLTPEVVELYEQVLRTGPVQEQMALLDDAFIFIDHASLEPLRPAFVALLEESEELLQMRGAMHLASIGVRTADERRLLRTAAEDGGGGVPGSALDALINHGGEAGKSDAFDLAKETDDYHLKMGALWRLAEAGFPVLKHKELLLLEFDDMDALGVPTEVVGLLREPRFEPLASDYLAWIRPHALDDRSPLHARSAWILANLRGDDEAVVDVLLQVVEAKGASAPLAVDDWLLVLARFPSQTRRTVPVLQRWAAVPRGPHGHSSSGAITALSELGAVSPEARKVFERLLESEHQAIREAAESERHQASPEAIRARPR